MGIESYIQGKVDQVKAAAADLAENNNVFNSARGGSASFDKKYQVSNHSYPNDLMTDTRSYGGNYVIFYINVAIDSKLAKDSPESDFIPVGDVPVRDRGDLIAMDLSKTGLAASATALNAGGAVLGKMLGVGAASGAAASVDIKTPLAL